MKTTWILMLVVIFGVGVVDGQREYPPVLEGTREVVYKKVGERELKLWVMVPEGEAGEERPGVVFFFGGGWKQGKHLAAGGGSAGGHLAAALALCRGSMRRERRSG